jgi:hypothetical protein
VRRFQREKGAVHAERTEKGWKLTIFQVKQSFEWICWQELLLSQGCMLSATKYYLGMLTYKKL